jgi:muramoyltetrapeptide carboxypeptidase
MVSLTASGSLLRRPRALAPGDRVAVVAPASAFDRRDLDLGLSELQSLGFQPVLDDSVYLRTGYVAGDARTRAAALKQAWADDTVSAVMAARGGYGSVQLLPYLDPAQFSAKVFVGSSDLTSLQTWLIQRAGVVTFHGPMPAGRFGRGAEGYDRDVFVRALTRTEPLGELPAPGLETLVPGEAAGMLVGGTLTQLTASLGTPYAFDPPTGAVLFLEDVGERPYRLDRLITQLALSGRLARVAAVVLGTFPGCDEPGGEYTARQTLTAAFAQFHGPVVFGLPAGHVDGPALTLPLGVQARIVATATPRVIIEEAAVS